MSFFPKTIPDWNGLPQEVVTAESLDCFKSRLNSLLETPTERQFVLLNQHYTSFLVCKMVAAITPPCCYSFMCSWTATGHTFCCHVCRSGSLQYIFSCLIFETTVAGWGCCQLHLPVQVGIESAAARERHTHDIRIKENVLEGQGQEVKIIMKETGFLRPL